jgi:tetratricopeptide (TPR) repeat protein
MQVLDQRTAAAASRLVLPLLATVILGCTSVPPAGAGGEPKSAQPTAQPTATAPADAPATGNAPPAAGPATDSPPEVPITGALMYQLMAAELAAQQGEIGAAYAIYLKLARETRDPRLARRATELAVQGRALPQSLEAAELWHEIAPGSRDAAQALALLYASSGRFDEALPLFATEVKAAAAPSMELARIQRQLTRVPDRKGAFGLLERLAQPYLNDADVRLVLAGGAQAAGLTDRAIAEARAAVALRPDYERAVLVAAQLLQATDRSAALSMLAERAARPGASSDLRIAYARLLVADRRYAEARAQFELLLQADPKNPDLLYSLGLLSMQGNLYSEARTYLQSYLALIDEQPGSERDPDQAYLYLAQLAEEEKQYAEALKWLRRIEGGDEYVQARVREALVLGKMQRSDEARKLLAGVQASSPDERVQLLLAEGQLLREANRYSDAYKLLTQAIEKSPDNVPLLYDAAMTAEKLDRVDDMESYLRKVIELRPDYAHAYNALGYTYADRNMRLPEALKLIEKANQLAPDDPYILDSLGWVHFRMGDLAAARRYLELAYDRKPDAEVAIHLAEVLWASGDQARARQLLREVRSKEPGNELLKSTVARLRIGL